MKPSFLVFEQPAFTFVRQDQLLSLLELCYSHLSSIDAKSRVNNFFHFTDTVSEDVLKVEI